jgi:heme/copper-type cytochrome/quinol oxidase subunit 4
MNDDRAPGSGAKPRSRVRSWGTIGAFTLIITLTVIEGIDEGFSLWDWLVIVIGALAIVQAISHLTESV